MDFISFISDIKILVWYRMIRISNWNFHIEYKMAEYVVSTNIHFFLNTRYWILLEMLFSNTGLTTL